MAVEMRSSGEARGCCNNVRGGNEDVCVGPMADVEVLGCGIE